MEEIVSTYIIEHMNISGLSYPDILRHSPEFIYTNKRGFFDIFPRTIEINYGVFGHLINTKDFPIVTVTQTASSLILTCSCKGLNKRLCMHQVQVLYNIIDRSYLRIFYDHSLRYETIKQVAKDYGMENENNLDTYFRIEYTDKAIEIKPVIEELYPVNLETNQYLEAHLLPEKKFKAPWDPVISVKTTMFLLFQMNKYKDQATIELIESELGKDGQIKNPLFYISPVDYILETEKLEEAKFFTAISVYQKHNFDSKDESVIEILKLIVANPLNLEVYFHDARISERVSARSIIPVQLKTIPVDIKLYVDHIDPFYEVSGEWIQNNKAYPLKTLSIKYSNFVYADKTLNLVTNPDILHILEFFKNNHPKILIHSSKYEEFRQNILNKLEHFVSIIYSHVKPATTKQIKEQGFEKTADKIIYLTDEKEYVSIIPVMKYGNVEVPVFSRKQIYDSDLKGNTFKIERDHEEEIRFTSILLRQHRDFEEQLNGSEYFYLHKEKFLDESWFLNTFEEWKNHNILILGFNELNKNKINLNKGKVTIHVISGVDWFNTELTVTYGKQKATLKQLHKSVRNKSKYVQLDDGTQGILPEEWVDRFVAYFRLGEVVDDLIKIPKNNYAEISKLFDKEVLSKEVEAELTHYDEKLSDFASIQDIVIPPDLHASLRDYQKVGLNWLNFLDDFNFGACLADDMGLGKTIQIIAFILLLRTKRTHNTNLVVVPTSLLFNWEEEVAKFAPSIKLLNYYGANRIKNSKEFGQYEIILTTYGTLISDILFLKGYHFNYIFLDEAQAIKNPESQRYKAARMLQSRNKVVITGTPIENNTFDIYGQLSFACPGLLGNKQHFKDIYSIPIDRFEDSKRATELQKKISPFILRRTKKQVATELPEKTEMVIYCEMGEEQRKVYNQYEKDLRDYISVKNEDEITQNTMHVLTGLTKLRQICNAPALLKDEEFKGDYSSKIEVLIEQIENKSPNHKILVFSQFVGMLDLIKAELLSRDISFSYLTGKTKDRSSVVNEFQSDESVRVFLISLKAGGTGLNLTEADYVYLVDPWWNPAVENQAIDRSYRIGQKKNVIAIRLICPDTIEDKIMKMQANKAKLGNDLIKTDGSDIKSFSKGDLMGMLG